MEACARWLDTLAEEGPGSKVGAVIIYSAAPFGIELFIRIWLADVVPCILVSVHACWTSLNIVFACRILVVGACTSDLSKPCPLGWRSDVNHDCLAPVGYSGPCVGRKNFHGMKHSERELWARTCDVKWSCAQRHDMRTPCTMYGRIVLPAGIWRRGMELHPGWVFLVSLVAEL